MSKHSLFSPLEMLLSWGGGRKGEQAQKMAQQAVWGDGKTHAFLGGSGGGDM